MSKKFLNTKNFCALPLNHLTIKTNGDFDICCIHQTPQNYLININHSDHESWLNSDYVKSVRNTVEQDRRHPGCRACWQREDLGFDSLRMNVNKEYESFPHDDTRPIKNIELQLGNLCNLQCLMCSEKNSSAILAENIRLGINLMRQTDLAWNDTGYKNLTKLLANKPTILSIRGGEPLYNKNLLKLVTETPDSWARNMVLQITTNATQWNNQWKQALSKFRLIRFVFSIDAVGELYEYMRYPASWTQVTQNIKSIMDLGNSKCLAYCVAQNLNISNLEPLLDWCESQSLYLQIDSLQKPQYLQIDNLPDKQKDLAIANVRKLSVRNYPTHLQKFLRSAENTLVSTEHDPDAWQEFVRQISMRDNLRGNSFRTWIKDS
jgi:molybdenum cofactor biosynthesis enzyme MoaA